MFSHNEESPEKEELHDSDVREAEKEEMMDEYLGNNDEHKKVRILDFTVKNMKHITTLAWRSACFSVV